MVRLLTCGQVVLQQVGQLGRFGIQYVFQYTWVSLVSLDEFHYGWIHLCFIWTKKMYTVVTHQVQNFQNTSCILFLFYCLYSTL